jgi:broad specificity phosphatase PhoE|eukprot:Stramenopile-MAST_4_protein_1419
MVRVLFIRHGMTKSNLRFARTAIQVLKGNISASQVEEFQTRQLSGEPDNEWCGDTVLTTDVGKREAEELGDHWAQVLQSQAEKGAIHVYVSPMQRCLQTIDPFMKRLSHLGIKGKVLPLIFELPGLAHRKDRTFVAKRIQPLLDSNDVDEAVALYRSHKFHSCGLSFAEMRKKFPWVEQGDPTAFPHDNDEPWYSPKNGYSGFQSVEETGDRVRRTVAFIYSLASTLASTDTVVFVSHGEYISETIKKLLNAPQMQLSLMNTSVSSLKILPDRRDRVKVEFINRTEHLNPDRQMRLYESMGLKEKNIGAKSKKRKDIGEIMLHALDFQKTPFGKFLSIVQRGTLARL